MVGVLDVGQKISVNWAGKKLTMAGVAPLTLVEMKHELLAVRPSRCIQAMR